MGTYTDIFYSETTEQLKLLICDLGRRMWQRGYVDGNGGNISVRLDEDTVLCTPTYMSKGFMSSEDLCLVNMAGDLLAGKRRSTSEIKTHLAIMRNNPLARACVHAHPPYATSYALCGQLPPAGVIAEAEIFLGEIGLAPYATPGSPEIEACMCGLAPGRSAVIMQGHGAITWGKTVEEAYWKMENLEAYCQVTHLVACRGECIQPFTEKEREALKTLRKKFES
ncbi:MULTISPECIES: class II aldolase/adducin family protein [Culturomica]|jgi:L-fuculose-phosphate aldolase|uniref:class II aldolase/adducin family protein n=1 Tax=Culturomica TaxID=1926651 RepID=UPI00033B172A|nr:MULTISPECIES: class II aldolase/adducin family protein [Odoribacteraceae]RHV97655.1 class II aldolase/adducin family protein [Odoribacter sp. OF09-27XD]CCZ07023.1 putative uncharacterized protein [Odoribacter sp. CAG:788]HBO27424.1 class II aldolase/adducin family protein [Culturomica sp.]